MNIQEALNVLNISGEVTEESLKAAFKKLALKFHPDRNPLGGELMKAVNAAYEFLMKNLHIVNEVKSKDENDFYDYGEEIEKVLTELAKLVGLNFEVVGNWIWIDGETKTHKDALHVLNCKWAPKKKKWFYRPEEHKSRFNRSEMSMEMIREKYGTTGSYRSRKGGQIGSAKQAITN